MGIRRRDVLRFQGIYRPGPLMLTVDLAPWNLGARLGIAGRITTFPQYSGAMPAGASFHRTIPPLSARTAAVQRLLNARWNPAGTGQKPGRIPIAPRWVSTWWRAVLPGCYWRYMALLLRRCGLLRMRSLSFSSVHADHPRDCFDEGFDEGFDEDSDEAVEKGSTVVSGVTGRVTGIGDAGLPCERSGRPSPGRPRNLGRQLNSQPTLILERRRCRFSGIGPYPSKPAPAKQHCNNWLDCILSTCL